MVRAMVTITTGARLTRNCINSSFAAEPIITFGGFPIISAVPPILDINTSEISTGIGLIFIIRQIEIVIGAISNAAVTESISAAPMPVIADKRIKSVFAFPRLFFTAHNAIASKKPDCFTMEIKTIMPASKPSVLKSINSFIAISCVT